METYFTTSHEMLKDFVVTSELIQVALRAVVLSGQESPRAFWCYRSSSLVALPRVPNW